MGLSAAGVKIVGLWLLVALLAATLDVVWARYNIACAARSPATAACYAAAIILLSGFNTVAFVGDHKLIVPVAIGSFVGTYFGVRK